MGRRRLGGGRGEVRQLRRGGERGGLADVAHCVVKEDAAWSAVRQTHDLAAWHFDGQLRREQLEDCRRDPQSVHVDYNERPGAASVHALVRRRVTVHTPLQVNRASCESWIPVEVVLRERMSARQGHDK